MTDCTHKSVTCLDPYDLIRKYRCNDCNGVMMCACDEEFGRRFLPHQLDSAREPDNPYDLPVTLGFQKGICNTCRGLPEQAYPRWPSYGRTTKIVRYYWREIYFDTTWRFHDWIETQGDRHISDEERSVKHDAVEREVIEYIKVLHQNSPKYIFEHEESQSEIIAKYHVEVVKLDGIYTKSAKGGIAILDNGILCSPEEYACRHFSRMGFSTLFTESIPFHALFGIMMWVVIQDPRDHELQMRGFGDRAAFEEGREGQVIWTLLPPDFGIPRYAERRIQALEAHFAKLPEEKSELLWAFDYWTEPSEEIRQYLWAHRLVTIGAS